MSEIAKVDLPSVASISCMRCKEAYPINSIEYMCFTDGNCQKCRAELSGKFADGQSLMIGADMVNHPPHYKDASGIECIEVTKHMQFCGGNCFKYLYRAGKKGSTIEDLKKAIWYAERAWLGSEQVCDDAVKKIEHIARYRTGFIQDAMQDMVDEDWLALIASVDSELDMLESE